MKILIVSSYLPYPLYSGGHIRLYNLIKNLSKEHEITLVCEKRDNQKAEDIEEVRKICKKVLTVDRKKQWTISNILKTGFSNDPFLLTGHKSTEMKNIIRDELVRENYDLIHVETFYVLQNLPKTHLPIVLVEHNIEYLVYKRYAQLSPFFIKPLLLLDVIKLKRKEEQAWKSVNQLVAVSRTEMEQMKLPKVWLVPNGVDTQKFKFREFESIGQDIKVLFIGDFKWIQNRDALDLILGQIWPKIKKQLLDLNTKINPKLWIVGRNLPISFKKYESSDIFFDTDNKEETWEIFRKSYILLAPLRAAGGTSYKILEAFASGVGVVTTNLGIEGLGAKSGIHALVAKEPDDLASCSVNLLTDKSLYRKLTHNSRKFVEENYDWKIISEKLNNVYKASL